MKVEKIHSKARLYTLLLLCACTLSAVLIAVMSTANVPQAEAQAYQAPSRNELSRMSEEECVAFVVESGIQIPEGFIDNPEFGGFTKSLIQTVEADPDYRFFFNYNKTLDFAESVKSLVNDYYGGIPQAAFASTFAAYTLQYNQLAGPWENDFPYYNCYAYAIEQTELPPYRPPYHYQHQPGDFAGTGSFYSTTTIAALAEVVKDDLEYLEYGNVRVEPNEPVNLAYNERLICIRRASWDYHFMQYNPEDGYWYHKPGPTAILKYLHHPEDMYWLHEGFDGYEFWTTGNVYNSDVYYIIFTPSDYFLIESDVPFTDITRDFTPINNNIPEIGNIVLEFERSGTKTLMFTVDGSFGYRVYDSGNNFLCYVSCNLSGDGSAWFYAVAGERYTLELWTDNYIWGYGYLSVVNSPNHIPIVNRNGASFQHTVYGGPDPNVHLIFYHAEDYNNNNSPWGSYRFRFTSSSSMTVRMHAHDQTNTVTTYADFTSSSNPAEIMLYISEYDPVYLAIYVYTARPDTPVTLTVTKL